MPSVRTIVFAGASLAVSLLSGCADERLSAAPSGPTETDAGGDTSVASDAGPPRPEASALPACDPIRSSETIPARSVAMSADVNPEPKIFYVQELFGLFKSTCGGCHVENSLGMFRVQLPAEFPTKVTEKVIDRINNPDPAQRMPPGSSDPTTRPPSDPVLQLAGLVRLWLDQGSPFDSFKVPREETDAGAHSPYLMSTLAGSRLTNIGSCLPNTALVRKSPDRALSLDAFFAGLQQMPPGQGTPAERIGLPETLDQTDLFTFDTEELARHRVIAYAPTYPLWSDGAHKLRHVRVPLGQSIEFDAEKQTFEIPENTRFYKTFLKPLREKDGTLRWRKVETRLIVARADTTAVDGTNQQHALFGTYEWNEDETEARLLTLPYRNGEPFTDHLFPIVVDEIKAQEVLDTDPPKPSAALVKAEAMRHYAVPGADRCRQCHMGSPTKDFVLGFFPLQLRRRPVGEGGVIEPTGSDELTQLQRFIDYGIITGMTSESDVVPLEDSQGARKPRNLHELVAQSYMLGNCAHCHNPRGFPTIGNPVLAGKLDFLPSATGGIFQFDMALTSPRITRGDDSLTPIPYITASLFDTPPTTASPVPVLKGTSEGPILAPWRSLIYRNVDTPFTYADDSALFPHMPVNTPGYDCRAPRIMGDWMVSIPARSKRPELPDCLPGLPNCDDDPQPFEEVHPGEADYDKAVHDAQVRLDMYHQGAYRNHLGVVVGQVVPKYQSCPNTSDIVDPDVTGADAYHRIPGDNLDFTDSQGKTLIPTEGVPDRAHWVATDITEVPGPWNPRRPDWDQILVQHNYGARPPASRTDLIPQWELTKKVASVLSPAAGPGILLDDEIRSFAGKEIPFGMWDESAHACAGSQARSVGSLSGDERPRWLREAPSTSPDAHVYDQLPGAAVFGMICINCHGANFDSRGRMADQLMMMTGGLARVANFRDGLFGKAGANRADIFAPPKVPDAPSPSVDDWAARYMVWMALGGTNAGIPGPILAIVNNTKVIGVKRKKTIYVGSANMLDGPRQFCAAVLPRVGTDPLLAAGTSQRFDPKRGWITRDEKQTPLIFENGDADLWLRLCAVNNPPPVRALTVVANDMSAVLVTSTRQFYPQAGYPATARVGDHEGHVRTGVQKDNLLPWCLVNTPVAQTYAQANPVGDPPEPLPICPPNLGQPMSDDDQDNWALRGAMNAGLSVFLYLDKATKDPTAVKPPYDRCDLLKP